MNKVTTDYFEWMCERVCDERYTRQLSYTKLLLRLFETNFNYILDRDGNRFEDGVALRYRFGQEVGIDDRTIARELDIKECSVLEMMIALAIRCEESIMYDPEIGDRAGKWFWDMIVNLGLGLMTDDRFKLEYVDQTVERFLMRDYGRNGEGGLFTIHSKNVDMRDVEIWYQAMWHLNEVSE